MDQNQEQEQVLIARNNDTGEIGAVKGQNPDGSPQLAEMKSAKLSDLVKFTKGQNPIEAFVSNFVRQAKNPSLFGFFKVPADRFDSVGQAMGDLIKDPEANAELLKDFKVDVPQQTQTEVKTQEHEVDATETQAEKAIDEQVTQEGQHNYQAIDESKIDWAAFKNNWGVDREQLEKSGDLEKMLNYGKSGLMKIQPTLAGEKMELDARLSLRTDANGNVKLVPHFIHLEPNLEKEYRGYQFTNADKEQLLKTGNLGRIVELNGKDRQKIPSYVSLDRQTNEIVSMPVDRLRIKGNIGKTVLTKEEIETLKSGQPIIGKEISTRDGKTFKTTLQVNADSRCVEFVPKAWQNHNQGEQQHQKSSQQQKSPQQRNSWTDENGNIRPISKWKDNHFTEQQKKDYVEGKTVVLENAVDQKGQPCTLYLKFDPKKQRPIASPNNPDLQQTVVPSNESYTQVAVNNEGKTNEATNKIKEPLQQAQTVPKNEEQKTQQRKPKGPKM